jgi:hypothetical protein
VLIVRLVLTQQQSSIASDLEEHTDGRKDDREELNTTDVSIDAEEEHGTRCESAHRGRMGETHDLADITAARTSQRSSESIEAPEGSWKATNLAVNGMIAVWCYWCLADGM